MTFHVLRAVGRDAALWQSFVDRLPYDQRDVMLTPAYARVQEQATDATAFCFVYEWHDLFVMQCVLLRSDMDGVNDLTSFYGGGGPVATSHMWDSFDKEFALWREENGVVCEYAQLMMPCGAKQRLLMGSGVNIAIQKHAVVVDIEWVDDALLRNFSRNRQRGVRQAQTSGAHAKNVELDNLTLSRFSALYRDSMERVAASERWVHYIQTWHAYRDHLGDEHMTIIEQRGPRDTQAMMLLVHGYGKAYAHFLGAEPDVSHDLLYYEAMRYARDVGCTKMYLGGGTTTSADDTLLQYKLSFSKSIVDVYAYRRVFDADMYRDLCERENVEDDGSWFPAYRKREAAA